MSGLTRGINSPAARSAREAGKYSFRGYSAGKVNYVLKKLVEKGLVKVDRFVNSKSKVQYKYLLTPEGIKEKIAITEKFIQIKKEEYDKLQQDLDNYKEQYNIWGGL